MVMRMHDALSKRLAELLMEGKKLHDECNNLYVNKDILVVAIQCHFVRATLQALDPGVWEAAGALVDGFMRKKEALERKNSGVN